MGSIYAVIIVNPGSDGPDEVAEGHIHCLVKAVLEPHRYRAHLLHGEEFEWSGWFHHFWYTGSDDISEPRPVGEPDPTDGQPCPACGGTGAEQEVSPFCYACNGLGWRAKWRFETAVAVPFVRLRFLPEYALTPDGRWHGIEGHQARCARAGLDPEATEREWAAHWQRLLAFYRHCWAVPVRLKG